MGQNLWADFFYTVHSEIQNKFLWDVVQNQQTCTFCYWLQVYCSTANIVQVTHHNRPLEELHKTKVVSGGEGGEIVGETSSVHIGHITLSRPDTGARVAKHARPGRPAQTLNLHVAYGVPPASRSLKEQLLLGTGVQHH